MTRMLIKKVRSVMIIDDDPINNMACEIIIKSVGFTDKVISFEQAKEALTHLKREWKNDRLLPEVILLDINMADMDGWEFLVAFEKELNDAKEEDKFPTIFIASSSVSEDDMKRALSSALVSDFLSKPLNQNTFRNLRNRWFTN